MYNKLNNIVIKTVRKCSLNTIVTPIISLYPIAALDDKLAKWPNKEYVQYI